MGTTSIEPETSTGTLTETLRSKLSNPATSPHFDLHGAVNEVLRDVGLTAADSGGALSFYGQDPIIPSPHRFGAMAAVGLAAETIALTALWKSQTGEGQDIRVDVGKAIRRLPKVEGSRAASRSLWHGCDRSLRVFPLCA